jgi:hypothetical protein
MASEHCTTVCHDCLSSESALHWRTLIDNGWVFYKRPKYWLCPFCVPEQEELF